MRLSKVIELMEVYLSRVTYDYKITNVVCVEDAVFIYFREICPDGTKLEETYFSIDSDKILRNGDGENIIESIKREYSSEPVMISFAKTIEEKIKNL